MKLFAYICNRLKPNNITKQNITKMKTKIFTLLLNKSLLSKLALIALLLTGGSNCVWGEETLTINDLSSNSNYGVPINTGKLTTSGMYGEFLVLSSQISELSGKSIKGLTFYTNKAADWGTASFTVCLKEVDNTCYSSSTGPLGTTGTTIVYTGGLSASEDKEVVVVFQNPFIYSGEKSLLVRINCTNTSGTNLEVNFTGANGSDWSDSSYKSYGTTYSLARQRFQPKVTIVYDEAGGDPIDVTTPTGLTASNISPLSADLSWTNGSDETKWQVSYSTSTGDHSTTTSDFTSKPYTLSGLTPGTTYYASIRAKKGSTYSDWSEEVSFTTENAVAVTNVSVSPTSWEMLAGASKTLTATIAPADATFKTVTWESSNSSVATVSSVGVVTAVAPGSATITVKSTTDESKSASCEIIVTAPVTPTGFKTKDLTSDYTYLTWTNGSTETTWQIKYGTSSGNLDNSSGDITSGRKPYLITGLSSNTTYYASIRSKLGTAYSDWSDELSFTTPVVGAAPGGAAEVIEDFESGWNVDLNNKLTGIKDEWGRSGPYNIFKLSSTYRHGDEGYGLSMEGYNATNFIILPAVKQGSSLSFWSCRAYSSMTGTVTLYKAIKVGSTYYVDNSVVYATVNHSSEGEMIQTTSSLIPEGGYVAILLNRAAIDDIVYQSAPTVRAITDDNGYTTFASNSSLDLSEVNLPAGLEAYKAKVTNTMVKFTEIDQSVPANTGVLLKGEPYTEYKIAVAAASSSVEDNDFQVNNLGYTFAAESGYTYFGMKKNSNPLTFAPFDPSSVAIPSDKAYLKVPTSAFTSSARGLTLSFESDSQTTGISEMKDNVKGSCFNLNGQRVKTPHKGLYIENGRKVILR